MTHDPTELTAGVEAAIAEANKTLLAPADSAFAKRAAVIDLLEVHVIDRLQQLEERAGGFECLRALREHAARVQQQLEAANERFVRRLRARIREGHYTRAGLARAFGRCAGRESRERDYDALDQLIAALMDASELQDERVEREPEMVAYQPTPGRLILELLERADLRAGERLIDLGSGLGWVVILVALLSEARAIGIELEPSFVEYARSSARALKASRAQFVLADARDASLAEADAFFLYTPFQGRMLEQVLDRLRLEAQARAIRICSYGPCTADIARANWLAPRAGNAKSAHEIVVFEPAR